MEFNEILFLMCILAVHCCCSRGGHRICIQKTLAEARVGAAEDNARRILENAAREAASTKKEALVQTKEEIHRLREEVEKENHGRREELQQYEHRLVQKEEYLDRKSESFEQREHNFSLKESKIREQQEQAELLSRRQAEKLRGNLTAVPRGSQKTDSGPHGGRTDT